jgi:hypothetical protein
MAFTCIPDVLIIGRCKHINTSLDPCRYQYSACSYQRLGDARDTDTHKMVADVRTSECCDQVLDTIYLEGDSPQHSMMDLREMTNKNIPFLRLEALQKTVGMVVLDNASALLPAKMRHLRIDSTSGEATKMSSVQRRPEYQRD